MNNIEQDSKASTSIKNNESHSSTLKNNELSTQNVNKNDVHELISNKQELKHTSQQAEASPPMDTNFSWSGYFNAIGILCIILAILWTIVWLLKKYGRFKFLPKYGNFPKDGLHIEAQLALGPQKTLTVVRFLDQRLLLGVTEQHISLIKEIPNQEAQHELSFKEVMEKEQNQSSYN